MKLSNDLNSFCIRLDYKFKNINLLIEALTHSSRSSATRRHNQRLEFLGDRVLGIVISKKLLELYPNEKVGSLDKKFASLVNKNMCLEIGKKLKIDNFINIGKDKSRM